MMNYIVNDQSLDAVVFIPFANKIWPGDYDLDKTQTALSKTQNITAYDGKTLVGVLRILTDGYFFGTITELLVHPEYQNRESAADFYSLPKIIPQLCYILAHSQGWKRSMRKTAVKKACSPT